MKLTEALYIAFVIGHKGNVYRKEWRRNEKTKYKQIMQTAHYLDIYDDWFLSLQSSFSGNSYVKLTDELKDEICKDLHKKPMKDYGLGLFEDDMKAEDWAVSDLLYVSDRFLKI